MHNLTFPFIHGWKRLGDPIVANVDQTNRWLLNQPVNVNDIHKESWKVRKNITRPMLMCASFVYWSRRTTHASYRFFPFSCAWLICLGYHPVFIEQNGSPTRPNDSPIPRWHVFPNNATTNESWVDSFPWKTHYQLDAVRIFSPKAPRLMRWLMSRGSSRCQKNPTSRTMTPIRTTRTFDCGLCGVLSSEYVPSTKSVLYV